ncbi:MAG: hypothetical protein L3J00_06360 [Thiomicrorhabdus sp.]|nr:hypothetical protein [Thiomicrorhabdus sp.]
MSGGNCPNITGLTLDRESLEGLKRIKRDEHRFKLIAIIFPAGTMYTIFAKRTVRSATINISKNDWTTFTEGMATLSKAHRHFIEKESLAQILRHSDTKQKKFWEAIFNGCVSR